MLTMFTCFVEYFLYLLKCVTRYEPVVSILQCFVRTLTPHVYRPFPPKRLGNIRKLSLDLSARALPQPTDCSFPFYRPIECFPGTSNAKRSAPLVLRAYTLSMREQRSYLFFSFFFFVCFFSFSFLARSSLQVSVIAREFERKRYNSR